MRRPSQLERGWIYGSELAPIAEVNAAGQVVQTYVYASRPNVPDLIVQADGDVYRVVHDHLGSVRLVVDARTGVVVHRMRFDEWGVLVEESGDATLHPFGYAGGILDRTTGLTRFGARDYEPGAGRWTAKDPIGFEGGLSNLYSYVNETPTTRLDPAGTNYVDLSFTVALGPGIGFGIMYDTTNGDVVPYFGFSGGGPGASLTVSPGTPSVGLFGQISGGFGPGAAFGWDEGDWYWEFGGFTPGANFSVLYAFNSDEQTGVLPVASSEELVCK